ncbi:metal ABC transporter ATP-binding protein [Corynebacterium sp. 335C]
MTHSADTAAPALAVRGLTVSYGDSPVLRDVDFDVPVGAVMGLLGPNGAGKSTALRAAMGLIPKSSGEARFFGEPLDDVRRRVAYMPQTARVDLDYPITVEKVVLMGVMPRLGWFGRVKGEHREIADRAIERMGLQDLRKRQIGELSGGQLKRTFFARILAQQPELYFLDEPFAGVDMVSERVIGEVLDELVHSGATVVLVHHDLGAAREVCSHVTLLDGRVVATGTVEEAFTQENLNEAYGLGLP